MTQQPASNSRLSVNALVQGVGSMIRTPNPPRDLEEGSINLEEVSMRPAEEARRESLGRIMASGLDPRSSSIYSIREEDEEEEEEEEFVEPSTAAARALDETSRRAGRYFPEMTPRFLDEEEEEGEGSGLGREEGRPREEEGGEGSARRRGKARARDEDEEEDEEARRRDEEEEEEPARAPRRAPPPPPANVLNGGWRQPTQDQLREFWHNYHNSDADQTSRAKMGDILEHREESRTEILTFLKENYPDDLRRSAYQREVDAELNFLPAAMKDVDLEQMKAVDHKGAGWAKTMLTRTEKVPGLPLPEGEGTGSDDKPEKREIQHYAIPMRLNGRRIMAQFKPTKGMTEGRIKTEEGDFEQEVVFDFVREQWVSRAQHDANEMVVRATVMSDLQSQIEATTGGGADSASVRAIMESYVEGLQDRVKLYLRGDLTYADLVKELNAAKTDILKEDSNKKSRSKAKWRVNMVTGTSIAISVISVTAAIVNAVMLQQYRQEMMGLRANTGA